MLESRVVNRLAPTLLNPKLVACILHLVTCLNKGSCLVKQRSAVLYACLALVLVFLYCYPVESTARTGTQDDALLLRLLDSLRRSPSGSWAVEVRSPTACDSRIRMLLHVHGPGLRLVVAC